MDPFQYYLTTITKALTKIGPLLAFIVVGYFIFFKLPFLLFLKNMKKNKDEQGVKPEVSELKKGNYSIDDYNRFLRQKKQIEAPENQSPRKPAPLQIEDGGRQGKFIVPDSPEALFEIKLDQKISKEELKKKYYELLRQNHPDKVANLSPEFKKLADRKTKQINEAYEKLLKRAV